MSTTTKAAREEKQPVMISVIIPVYNGSASLGLCLEGVTASDYSCYECIVVNDGSTDGSQTIATQFPIRVLELCGGPFGPAYARNRGAKAAQGKILFFVDADVIIVPGAVREVAKLFQEHPDLAALFGSYDIRPQAKGWVSQYRNLLHHFVHQQGNAEASTFWAGCGAIRRSVFEKIGGFDEKRFPQSSIEDIELGYRLRQAGYRILLHKALQGTHLKRWTLFSVIWTDITRRAVPWSRLILESKKAPDDLNLKLGQRLSFALLVLACVSLILSLFRIELLALSTAALFGVLLLNRDLYAFFFRQRGPLFSLACISLHLLYYLYSGMSYLFVWSGFHLRGRTTHRLSAIHKR
jgi:glycosyltransferase involved in cell wall biosynthesis